MGKTYIDTVKYLIKANIETDGIVEKPDVVGAIFGQTEGLLGDELDLRELQKSGRIGRIEVEISTKSGKSVGTILVPSSLNADNTSALAAALEQIERVGPCEAKIDVESVRDTRTEKREKVIKRAQEIRRRLMRESRPESREISKAVRESVRQAELVKYGPEKIAAGPDIEESDDIIVVEGRADVLNLLRSGIKNVIALHGKKVPKTVAELTKKKTATAFVDGDRGGKLIIKQLADEAEVDYVAKAPDGKEVEELTQKEILKCLRRKVSLEQFMTENFRKTTRKRTTRKTTKKKTKKPYEEEVKKLKGTLKGILINKKGDKVAKVDVRDLAKEMKKHEDLETVVFDGIITQRMIDIANTKKINQVVGTKKGKVKDSKNVEIVIVR